MESEAVVPQLPEITALANALAQVDQLQTVAEAAYAARQEEFDKLSNDYRNSDEGEAWSDYMASAYGLLYEVSNLYIGNVDVSDFVTGSTPG